MAAPSLFDGVSRAIEEIAVPSVVLLTAVGVIRVFYGGQEAGIAYIALTALLLAGIYTSAKYWNVRYTIGFAAAGIAAWIGVPSVIPELVPSQFATIGAIVVLVFLVLIAARIIDKW